MEKRVQLVKNCYQCQYGMEESEEYHAWCAESCRNIEDMNVFPDFCPLQTVPQFISNN